MLYCSAAMPDLGVSMDQSAFIFRLRAVSRYLLSSYAISGTVNPAVQINTSEDQNPRHNHCLKMKCRNIAAARCEIQHHEIYLNPRLSMKDTVNGIQCLVFPTSSLSGCTAHRCRVISNYMLYAAVPKFMSRSRYWFS
jgi:hypothetical protein